MLAAELPGVPRKVDWTRSYDFAASLARSQNKLDEAKAATR